MLFYNHFFFSLGSKVFQRNEGFMARWLYNLSLVTPQIVQAQRIDSEETQ